jgi:hypothetical protein
VRPTIGRKPEVLERRDRERERAAATAKTAEKMDLQDDETMDAVVAASIESHGVDAFDSVLHSDCCLWLLLAERETQRAAAQHQKPAPVVRLSALVPLGISFALVGLADPDCMVLSRCAARRGEPGERAP